MADDTAVFISNINEVSKVVACIQDFSSVSGLKININKSVLFPLKKSNLTEVNFIPVKDKVTYLGVIIEKDRKLRSLSNFGPVIEQITKKFNMWLMRDLSLNGRVLLSKAEGISRSVYTSLSLEMPNNISKKLDKILFNFIWKHKNHYLKRDILCNTKENGGLEVLSFEMLNNSFKIKWLLNLLKEKDTIWNTFPKHVFNLMGGLKFLLKCDYKIEKLPVKLSGYHQQALLSWKLAYKHNFSPTSYYIWNNGNILYKNKSLYFKNWVENDILLVKQLMSSNGNLLTYGEFLFKFKLPVTPKEFAVVFDALPSGVLQLLQGTTESAITNLHDKSILIGEVDVTKKKCSNKLIRAFLQKVTLPSGRFFWSSLFGYLNWKQIWLSAGKFCLTNKVKEVTFKILHNVYPVKKTLERFNLDIDYSCTFCEQNTETICHLFYQCMYTRIFWSDVQHFIQMKTGQVVQLTEKDVLLCFDQNDMDKDYLSHPASTPPRKIPYP